MPWPASPASPSRRAACGRTEATGRGVCFGIGAEAYAEDMRKLGLDPGVAGKRVVVQGLGNVGYHTAKFLQEAGARLVALAEYDGAIYNPVGLDIDTVQEHRRETGSILYFPGAKNFAKNTDALEYECDLLIPAALEGQLTAENAPHIKVKIVCEAANGPTTAAAEEILKQCGIMVIPDLYLNAGGVTVSYFEWLKNLSHVRFGRLSKRFEEGSNKTILSALERLTGAEVTPEERQRIARGADELDLVNSGLEETMVNAYDTIRHTMLSTPGVTDLRTAAFVRVINKIAISYLDLGIFP